MLNTEYLTRCIETLEKSYACIESAQEGSIDYEMYRNSLVRSFEITLEQSGKLLRKCLAPYYASKKIVDGFAFKDLFREAHKHSLLTEEEVKRWFMYRNNRNNTAHDYGKAFAEETLKLMDSFLKDVHHLKEVIEHE